MAKARHIRHDWRQFGNWPQKSCSTACGVKSTYNNCGIPGIDDDVEWCMPCVRTVWYELKRIEAGLEQMEQDGRKIKLAVSALYGCVTEAIADQFFAYEDRKRVVYAKNGLTY